MKMYNCVTIFIAVLHVAHSTTNECDVNCPEVPDDETRCAFATKLKEYLVFPTSCALVTFAKCKGVELVETSLDYCIKDHLKETRRMYGESCPTFCPAYYRPVCGASKFRDYIYRSFINGCYLDMLNCRSDDEYNGYVEVPLEFCQRHAMKNIFNEQIVLTGPHSYRNYNLRK